MTSSAAWWETLEAEWGLLGIAVRSELGHTCPQFLVIVAFEVWGWVCATCYLRKAVQGGVKDYVCMPGMGLHPIVCW